jgi:hypothetical protein
MTLKPAEVLTASLIVAASVVAGLIPTNPFARHTPAVRAGIDRPTHAMTRDPSSP